MIFFTLFDALVTAHISRRPWQVAAAMSALVFGAASMTALITANRAVAGSANAAVGRLTPDVNLQLVAATPFSDRLVAAAQHVAGVTSARPVIERAMFVQTLSGDRTGVRFIGTDLLAPVFVDERARADLLPGPYSPSGRVATPAQLVDGASVIADERLERRIAVGMHAELTLSFGVHQRIATVVDIVHDDESGSGDARIFADIDNAQSWLGLRGRIDRVDCLVDPARLASVRAHLMHLLPASVMLIEPVTRTRAIIESTRGIGFALVTIGVFAALLAAFAAYSLFGAAVVQRRADVATLRSLGVERVDVLRVFAIEAMLYGVLGSIAGISCGMIFGGLDIAAVIEGGDVAAIVFIGVAATFGAAMVPAARSLARDVLTERRDPLAGRDGARSPARAALVLSTLAVAVTLAVRTMRVEGLLVVAFLAVALAASFVVTPFAVRALRFITRNARRSDVRIATALGDAHAGRTLFAAIPTVAAISALCVASVLVVSGYAALGTATRSVFGTDAAAVVRSFDLTYGFLRGAIVLLITVAAIAIGSIWFGALLERRTAYRTLSSLGMSAGDIARSILFEVLVIAGCSCIAGLICGIADLGMIAASNAGRFVDPGQAHIPIVPIAGYAIAVLALSCIAATPAALIVSRGSLRRVAD